MKAYLDPSGVLTVEADGTIDEYAMREWVNQNLRFHRHPDAHAVPHWNFLALKITRAPADAKPA